MAFDIESIGEHEIEFKYMPSIYVKAGIISGASFVVFFGLCAFEIVNKKKKKVACVIAQGEDEAKETTEGEN